MAELRTQEQIVPELFKRAFSAGLQIGMSDSIKMWCHVELRGNRYFIEWSAQGNSKRMITSPIGDETDWAMYERPHSDWVPVEDGRGGA